MNGRSGIGLKLILWHEPYANIILWWYANNACLISAEISLWWRYTLHWTYATIVCGKRKLRFL